MHVIATVTLRCPLIYVHTRRLLKVSYADHHSDPGNHGGDFANRLAECRVAFKEFRQDRHRGDVNESAGREWQNPDRAGADVFGQQAKNCAEHRTGRGDEL